jgi:hypothetical protein
MAEQVKLQNLPCDYLKQTMARYGIYENNPGLALEIEEILDT